MMDVYQALKPLYSDGEIMDWKCDRCGWEITRDSRLSDSEALALARAAFLDHTCISASGPGAKILDKRKTG